MHAGLELDLRKRARLAGLIIPVTPQPDHEAASILEPEVPAGGRMGDVSMQGLPGISPEEASRSGALVRDQDLAMLAAVWLAQGFDSPELRELAGLTRDESRTMGARLLRGVLASLGWPMRDLSGSPEELPWLGYWHEIAWAKEQMDRLVTPYAAAQRVIEVAGDVPDLWIPAGGERLVGLLGDWDECPADRRAINDQIRRHLRSLREQDVPPLISGS